MTKCVSPDHTVLKSDISVHMPHMSSKNYCLTEDTFHTRAHYSPILLSQSEWLDADQYWQATSPELCCSHVPGHSLGNPLGQRFPASKRW